MSKKYFTHSSLVFFAIFLLSTPISAFADGAVLGFRLGSDNQAASAPAATPTLVGPAGTISLTGNPYNSNFITNGTYAAYANSPAGYTASYWLCYSNCTTPVFVSGENVSVNVSGSGQAGDNVTLWWKYTPNTPPLSATCSVSPASITAGQSAAWTVVPSGGTGNYAFSWSDTSGANGSTGAARTWSHAYTSAGVFGASVSFTDGQSAASAICTRNLTVNAPANASCQFNNQTIAHGASVSVYQSPSAVSTAACDAIKQTRVCNNGTLSGTYTYASCSVLGGTNKAAVLGFKLGSDNQAASAPAATPTLVGPAGTISLTGNPYNSGFIVNGTYTAYGNAPSGYSAAYWLCYDQQASCTTPAFVDGSQVSVTVSGTQQSTDHITLWWKYMPVQINPNIPHVIPGQVSNHTSEWTRGQVLLQNFRNMYNGHVHVEIGEAYPYKMWFFGWAATDCNVATITPGTPCDRIFYARSVDGNTWYVYSGDDATSNPQFDSTQNPALWKSVISAQNAWYDTVHNGDPSVVKVGTTYYMVYTASGNDLDGIAAGQPGDRDGDSSEVMGATSADGIHWQRSTHSFFAAPGEAGGVDTAPGNMYARPSLMYENGKFKMWFDYWASDTMGLSMGYAEMPLNNPTPDSFLNGSWNTINAANNPQIINWPNPNVIHVGNTYYSYADPVVTSAPSWQGREVTEATSADGLHWTIQGYVDSENGCAADHVPEAYVDQGKIHVVYGCQAGGNPYDYRYKQIRRMTKQIPTIDPVIPMSTSQTTTATNTDNARVATQVLSQTRQQDNAGVTAPQQQSTSAQTQSTAAASSGGASSYTPATSGAYCPKLTRMLSIGMHHAQVISLKKYLSGIGLIAVTQNTDYFGPLTEKAVQAYQSSRGIVSSGTPATTGYGSVGKKTRAAIASCK